MSIVKKILVGCFLLPILLVASCTGKMYYDAKMYVLPGQVLQSSAKPTQHLGTAMEVAEALDTYVQPRFEILRDRNFGAMRIVYRKHAGIVQLKVDTPEEHTLIANINAANRDYAISLLHCAPKPESTMTTVTPRLELLYFNQGQVVSSQVSGVPSASPRVATEQRLDWDALTEAASTALPSLMQGREHRTSIASWNILMRPVLASKQECLSCHTNAKAGAPLGVMVYAVRKAIKHSPATVSLR